MRRLVEDAMDAEDLFYDNLFPTLLIGVCALVAWLVALFIPGPDRDIIAGTAFVVAYVISGKQQEICWGICAAVISVCAAAYGVWMLAVVFAGFALFSAFLNAKYSLGPAPLLLRFLLAVPGVGLLLGGPWLFFWTKSHQVRATA